MKLALFFTEGISLETWKKVGMLDREIKPYNKLAASFEKIFFITYGSNKDFDCKSLLEPNIIILPKKINVPNRMYSFLIPFLYRKELQEADLYKTNQMQGSWSAILAGFFFKKKVIVRCGYQWSVSVANWKLGKIKQNIVYLLEKLAYRKADQIIVTAAADKLYVEQRYGIANKKIAVLPNYIDVDLFKPDNNFSKEGIIYVGRLEKEKNVPLVIEAAQLLKMKLDIYGNGSLAAELKAMAKESDKINFCGNISNNQLPRELNRHAFFLLTSSYEGNPKALLEAMACGSVVVASNVRGINSVITHEQNGLLCDLSVESVKNAIIRLQTDEEFASRLAKNAREYVVRNNSLDHILNQELIIYKHLYESV